MSSQSHQAVVLTSRPTGIPQAENFEVQRRPRPTLDDGEVLVRNVYLSVEPAMRGWIVDTTGYAEPVAIDSVMRAFTTGQVVASRVAEYAEGDYVTGLFGWQEYAAVTASTIIRKVDNTRVPLSTSLGVLGLNGLTAYFGLLEAGALNTGETVVVSTAAGSVGSCVGQIAVIRGCKTIGITGGPVKRDICKNEFGYSQAIDYRSGAFEEELLNALSGGVDVYFDNTAGPISDLVLTRLNKGARIVVCGTASIAEWDPLPVGPRMNRQLLVARARIQGFLVLDYADRYAQALVDLEQWVANGLIRYREDILDGIDQAPDAIAGLYRGENMGKRLIRIAEE